MAAQDLANKISIHVNARYPDIVIPLAGLSAPLTTFFSVPVLFAVLGFLVLDLITGLTKARLAKKICSQNFGNLFERMAMYVVIFVVLHVLTIFSPAPFNMGSQVMENFVMMGLLLKEALSILENLKAIAVLRKIETPVLDVVIDKLGLDIDHILADVKELPTASAQDQLQELKDKALELQKEVPVAPGFPQLEAVNEKALLVEATVPKDSTPFKATVDVIKSQAVDGLTSEAGA